MPKPWQYFCPIPLDPSHDRSLSFSKSSQINYLSISEYKDLAIGLLHWMKFSKGTTDEDVISYIMYCGMLADATWDISRGKSQESYRFFKMRRGILEVLKNRRWRHLTEKARMDERTISVDRIQIPSKVNMYADIDIQDMIASANLNNKETLMLDQLVFGYSLNSIAKTMKTSRRQARYVRDSIRRKFTKIICRYLGHNFGDKFCSRCGQDK